MTRASGLIRQMVGVPAVASGCAKQMRAGRSSPTRGVLAARAQGRPSPRQRLDVVGDEGLATDPPLTVGYLLDHAPDGPAHVLALDLDHRVGEALHDLLLLGRCEHAFE